MKVKSDEGNSTGFRPEGVEAYVLPPTRWIFAVLLLLGVLIVQTMAAPANAAAPVWHTADEKTASGTGTSVSVASPTNVSAGDLVILIITQQRSPGSPVTGFATPDGFNLIRRSHAFSSNAAPEVVAYYRIASGSEPTSYTTTTTSHGSNPAWKVVAGRVTGHDPVDPIGNRSSVDSGTGSVNSLAVPSLVTTGKDSLLIATRTVRRDAGATPTAPSGMTEISNQNGTGTGDNNANAPALQVARQDLSAMGTATGTRTFSWTGTARASALMFEIRAYQSPNVPRVNGLFYGSGDNNRYPSTPYAVSTSGSRLYLSFVNGVLYVSLVVDRKVNDNVFDNGQASMTPYLTDANWENTQATAGHRMNSEYAEFELTVTGESGPVVYNWRQGYAGQTGGGSPESRNDRRLDTYRADTTVSGGVTNTAPPGLVMASSLQWNLNNYARRWQTGTNVWTMPGSSDTNSQNWKSPWLGAGGFSGEDPDQVVGAQEGYPPIADQDLEDFEENTTVPPITYSSTYEWEWSMIYEWAIDLTQFGASPVFVVAGSSHHSPRKRGPGTDDPFEEPEGGNPPLLDFGDLPASYPTLLVDDGARHAIDPAGVLLGSNLDNEADGQPSVTAQGDDSAGVDDEDGIVFLTPLVPGTSATVQVTVGNTGGYLSGFIDFNGDETLTQVNVTNVTGPGPVDTGLLGDRYFPDPGVYTLTIDVPANATGVMPSRWRITNESDQGGNSITGQATSGEVEDYIFLSSIGDYVWADVNQNGIQDADEDGVEGVTVNLRDANDDVVATTTTDANGFYEFTGLVGGNYRVEFALPEGYVGFTAQEAGTDPTVDSNANSNGLTDTLTLAPNQVRSDIDAGLVPEGSTPTAVVLGEFELEVMEVTQLLRALGAGDADNAGLLALLQTWDPGAAAALAGAGRDELSRALVDHLDPDGDGRVAVLRWETLEEIGTMGFYVDRRDGRDWTRINNTMLPAMVGAHWGGEYWLADPGARPGGSYQYRLIEIEARGTTQEYGPFDLRMGGQ